MRNFLLLSFIASAFLFNACSNNLDPDDLDLGYDYIPVAVGNSISYDVMEIIFTEFEGYDTSYYQLKEEVVDTIFTLANEMQYKIHTYVRADSTAAWEIDSVWTIQKTDVRVVKRENNIDFVKLIFPIAEGKEWNGNSMNQAGEETYTMENINWDFTTSDSVQFSNTLTVKHEVDTSNIISRRYEVEVFQRDVGLVHKQYENYQYVNQSTDPFFGQFHIVGGRFLRWTMFEADIIQ